MRAAVQALRQHDVARIVIAVPIGSPQVCGEFVEIVDEIVRGITPEFFPSVGHWFDNFDQLTDSDVGDLLKRVDAIRAQSPEVAVRGQ